MNKRTELYLRIMVPLRVIMRNRMVWLCENLLRKLDAEKCVYNDDSLWTFSQMVRDPDLFVFGEDDDDK